jgi:hypothetical protein
LVERKSPLRTEQIVFSNQQKALCLVVPNQLDLQYAIQALRLSAPCPVLVWIGGANSMERQYAEPVGRVAQLVAEIAQERKAIVIDGATDSGVMAVMGRVYAQGDFTFPLVGVVARKLVDWGNVPAKSNISLLQRLQSSVKALSPGSASQPGQLDPYHTHFFMIAGRRWGAESPWISQIATRLSGGYPSVTILSNGRPGGITGADTAYSVRANRPVIVAGGTGGWADELADQPRRSALWKIVQADNPAAVCETILACLA